MSSPADFANEDQTSRRATIDRQNFEAAIFDLDGVLTDTARVHAAAWKAAFDPVFERWAIRRGVRFEAFDTDDYLAHIDGRPRLEGVRALLRARGVDLPEDSGPGDADSVRSLAERKADLFRQMLRRGIAPLPGAEPLLRELRRAGLRIAVASSSKNCAAVLSAVGFEGLIDSRVDGVDAERLGLPGKPDPALFLEAARRLGVEPRRIVLFEDFLAGVEAGRSGGFGRVVGIGRRHEAGALRERGADLTTGSLECVDVAPA